ncbi:MAG: hypothetical protein WC860_07675 [Candidatus Margulisiibacteriota bacterium]|jgi:hypothetical protein
MPNIDDLSTYIQNNDTKGFLLCYLQILDEGAALSVPTSLEEQKTNDGWLEILSNVTGGYTDEFVSELTKLWLSIVTKQGGTITKTFAKELIAIIQNKPKPAPEPENAKITTKAMPLKPISPNNAAPTTATPPETPEVNYDNDTITSKISDNYYSLEEAKETKLSSKDEIAKNIKLAIIHKKPNLFLINYLSNVRHNEAIKVPITSILESIRSQWEDILKDKFDYQPETDFLKEIAAKWFYLVNLKGLPNNKEKLENFLYYLIANNTEQLSEEPALNKKESFIFSFLRKFT